MENIDRRGFLKASALFGGAAALTGLTACAPSGKQGQDLSTTGSSEPEAWDEEYDFVVVGGGCGVFGALLAAQAGAKVALVEKGSTYGGTMALSGNGMWVPNNKLMSSYCTGEDEFNTADTEADLPAAVDYAISCDPFGATDPELAKDYVYNIAPMVEHLGETFGIEYGSIAMTDYYMLPGAKNGRAIGFAKDGVNTGTNTFATIIEPLVEQYGVTVMLNTEATSLCTDDAGAVTGVVVSGKGSSRTLKANKGVLLNTGGFEHNEEMVATYLRGPILGCNSVQTNTGDGHRMATAVGADLGNMSSCWGVPFYKTNDESMTANLCDWMTWRYGDHSIIVNSAGRRFGDESAAYAPANLDFYQYSSKTYSLPNIPAFHIGDQSFVSIYNYPGVTLTESAGTTGSQKEGLPEWVKVYDSLEELAADNGIDAEALVDEVNRWNAFCDAGVDGDFGREANRWTETFFYMHDEKNPKLGKIDTPPYFCATIVPGTCGTNGGIKVNADAQALNCDGEVIPGLYASGNCSAAYFGSAYPGGGTTVGSGVYRACRAANHAFDLGIV